jgi:Helix-loop-helix DNA-binding domain
MMPSRNLYLRAPNGELELITPPGLLNPENNVFDKAFNAGTNMEEWDDWMKWEAAELEFPENRRESLASNISSPEAWSTDHESSGKEAISCAYSTSTEFPFEDAPFEIDETPLQSSSLPLGVPGTLFPENFQPQRDLRRSFRGFSSLTEAEERDLQDIAMPSRMLSAIKLASETSSPASSHSNHSPSPSPEPETRTRKTNKRKTSLDDREIPSALCQSRKRGHNAIEKRYRTNLNDKINCLREGIPSLSRQSSSEAKSDEEAEDSDVDMDSKTAQQKYGKAAILTRALEYIKHLENTTQRLGGEVDALKTRVGAFEKLAMSGSIVLNGKGLGVPTPMVLVKSETLESIQAGTFSS